jgi:hypothetical protein
MKQFPPLFGKDPLQLPDAEPGTAGSDGNRPYCIYSFEVEVSSARIERAIAALRMEGARPVKESGAKGSRGVHVSYQNLLEAKKVAVALRKRLGPLRLTIPHLGLDHREVAGDIKQGNGAWFGFSRRDGVIVSA